MVGIVFEIVVIFVLFEAVPKNWAVQHPDRAALLSAPDRRPLVRFPPIRWLSGLLIGLANLLIGVADDDTDGMPRSYITESELLAMADVAHEEDVIETRRARPSSTRSSSSATPWSARSWCRAPTW